MRIQGFTAESSLYRVGEQAHLLQADMEAVEDKGVVPQLT
jgi:hypothetical protein